jgi:threonylcarbamoyladenosine tRNA methylthiotransferase MtaB
MPHFHIPLQSGSDKILSLMRRRYKRELYANRVAKIKEMMPDCCIGVDVIVGFPGETREDFIDTYNFLNELNVSYLHVFTYSRSKMLHILSDKKRRAFYESQLNKTNEVLFEGDIKDGFMHGFTRNYVKVRTKFDPVLVNELKTALLTQISPDGDFEITESEEIFAH